MKGVVVKVVSSRTKQEAIHGSAGLSCHVPGGMVTVSNVANATGGINAGNLLEADTR